MKEICVAHLVRAHNGIETFKKFLESYQINSGGIEHDLLIIFKGFDNIEDIVEYKKILTPFAYTSLNVVDYGYDITAYFTVIKCFSEHYNYFCFLNSHSIILDKNWLKKLYENICKKDVGLVGATGCWNSNNTNAHSWFRNLVTEIRYKKDISSWKNIKNLPPKENSTYKVVAYVKAAVYLIRRIWQQIYFIIHFDSFPNYHIRTNTFMISGEIMNSLNCPKIKTKIDAYKFEGGKKSLTKEIIKMGKTALIVGKDGIGYDKEVWHKSKIFWSYEQENLLVSDNQTIDYQNGTIERRNFLSSIAWGKAF